MKYFFIALLFISQLACHAFSYSKNNFMANNESDTLLVFNKLTLGSKYLSKNIDSALLIGNECLVEAKRINNKKFIAQSYNLIGRAHFFSGKIDMALNDFKNHEKFAVSLGEKAAAIMNQGNIYLEKADYNAAKSLYKKAGVIALKAKDTIDYIKTRNNLAYTFRQTGNLDSSVNYQIQALKAFEKMKHQDGIGQSYIQLAFTQYTRKFNKEAENYILEALKIYNKLDDKPNKAICYTILGGIYSDQKLYKKAEKFVKLSLEINLEIKDRKQIGDSYDNLAQIYNETNQLDLAFFYVNKALPYLKEANSVNSLTHAYTTFSEYYLASKEYNKALIYLDSAKATALNGVNLQNQKKLLEIETELYTKTGKKDLAINSYEKLITIKDSLFNVENSNQINLLKTRYETEKKEQQIKDLSLQTKIKDLEINKKNTLLLLGGGVLLLLVISAWLYFNRRKIQHKISLQKAIIEQQDLATKAILDAEERERRRIATDLHDGVGQLLSAALMNLNGFIKTSPDSLAYPTLDKSLVLVTESYDEMRSISHQMMPNALLKAGLTTAVREFLSKIDESQLKINLDIAGFNNKLDDKLETVLYRVIQESVNNVIKHAQATKLSIQLHKDEEGISLAIEDNGVGFDSSKLKDGIGLGNVKSRISFINGTVEYDSAPGKGTLVNIFIPNY